MSSYPPRGKRANPARPGASSTARRFGMMDASIGSRTTRRDHVEDPVAPTTHERLARHLAALGMGLPATADLTEILERPLTEDEAELLLAFPTGIAPLQVATAEQIAHPAGVDRPDQIEPTLERLLERGLLYSGCTPSGERGYALLQAGFGFPQTFFWAGEESDEAREMAAMVAKYANRHVLREMYGATPTKASAVGSASPGVRAERPGSPFAPTSPTSRPPISPPFIARSSTRRAKRSRGAVEVAADAGGDDAPRSTVPQHRLTGLSQPPPGHTDVAATRALAATDNATDRHWEAPTGGRTGETANGDDGDLGSPGRQGRSSGDRLLAGQRLRPPCATTCPHTGAIRPNSKNSKAGWTRWNTAYRVSWHGRTKRVATYEGNSMPSEPSRACRWNAGPESRSAPTP